MGTIVGIAFGLSIVVLLVIALRRMGWLGKTEFPVSSGIANALADVNAMLQPQQPTAEVIEKAKHQDEEDEDEGDDAHRNEPRSRKPS